MAELLKPITTFFHTRETNSHVLVYCHSHSSGHLMAIHPAVACSGGYLPGGDRIGSCGMDS